MSMEDGTLRKLELYLHDLHKKIDGIYDMLMLRHERETEQKGSSAINEKLLDNQDLCLLFQISPRSLQRYRSLGVLPYWKSHATLTPLAKQDLPPLATI